MSVLVSYDPATGAPVGEVPVTPSDQIPSVVARARRAQAGWGDRSLDERAEVLAGAAAVIAGRAEAIGRQLTQEMGKPLPEAIGEVKAVGRLQHELQGIVEALKPEVREDERTRSVLYRDPYGVVAVITPWNFPFMMPHWMAFPALVAGNAVVLKPSEETPLTGQAYADCLNEVLPEAVLQVVHGADDQGKSLVASDVDLVAFTGSRETGKHILAAASTSLKRVILELGGKDPMIVLDDADVQGAARFAARNSFRNAGQVCVSTERIYVHDAVADAFLDALVEETGRMRQGHGLDDGVRVGPMINDRQRDHVLAQIDEAVSQGAQVVTGGEHQGPFIRPTVLDGVTHDMGVAQDETFGPVVGVVRVSDDEEAARLANDTPFGLGAVVFGEREHAMAVARHLTAGMIGVNKSVNGAFDTPWVGARQSGYGFHSGRDGHRQFAQLRVVSTPR